MNYQKVYMNQIYSSSIMRQVAQMWKNQLLCDAVIKTGNVQTKAHRLVLIAACPMLQHMENASVGSHLEVRLNADIKQNSVNTFLQYLYEGYMMLTEENCKDVEKIAKLLHADSVAKCCTDFQKCLNVKSGMSSYEGANFEVQDGVEFRYVCSTNIQKTLQEGAMKRSSDSGGRPPSPGSKRPRVHPSSPSAIGQRADDRFSMAHSYTQDPFERVPRLGSGFSQPKPPPGVIEIIEDSVELVNTEPPERDVDGWPKKSDRPPVQKSMSIAVSSQVKGGDNDIQIINVSSSAVPPQIKPPSTGRGWSDATNERLSTSFDHSQSTRSTQKQPSFSTEQSQSPRTELDGSFQRQQQYSQSVPSNKQTPPRTSHPVSHPPQLKHMSMPGVQSTQKSFAAGSPSQASFAAGSASQVPTFAAVTGQQSSSPHIPTSAMGTVSMSPRSVSESSQPLPSPTKPSTDVSRRQQTVMIDQPSTDSLQQSQDSIIDKQQEKDTVAQKSIEIHSEDVERLLAASEPVTSQSDNAGGKAGESSTDLTIIKIEEEEDTGGLDMYVDIPEDSKQPVHPGGQEDTEDTGELEDPPGEWSREDFSNESSSNLGADPNVSWQDSFNKDQPNQTSSTATQELDSVGRPKACVICGFQASDGDEFCEHVKRHGYVTYCDMCGLMFKTQQGCYLHKKVHFPTVQLKCDLCGKVAQSRSHLNRHLKSHSDTRHFKCQYCKSTFKHKADMNRHLVNRHSDKEPYHAAKLPELSD
ncbi:zinc finger protein 768-like isoform X4 [Saccostrea echinata]|uniref:zinc finger protein 768-like isoform X4 n=1 Tax=Saccostrea echinata TaxID=191078 RepID=UPI002A833E3A|nr:zinc finger protein 768-like isoform X4 [Saccostrea echinata]